MIATSMAYYAEITTSVHNILASAVMLSTPWCQRRYHHSVVVGFAQMLQHGDVQFIHMTDCVSLKRVTFLMESA